VHAPFVLRAAQRAHAGDHDFAVAQRQRRAASQQEATPARHAFGQLRMVGEHAEQGQDVGRPGGVMRSSSDWSSGA
jgi:hypothetical protein